MINPLGKPPVPLVTEELSYVGIIKGGGGVYVGFLVGGISEINWDARVGSIVGVVSGVGVGGLGTIGSSPVKRTYGA